jgi:3-dehydroquinate dehydratase I
VATRPKICAVITSPDVAAIRRAEEWADLLEVRIDLIGEGWLELSANFTRPWIAANRRAVEGGKWTGGEVERVGELLRALELGADIVDIELGTVELAEAVKEIKKEAVCLVSFHDLKGTPPLERLKEIARQETCAGADICKVVTTATTFGDNAITLALIREFPGARIVSFAQGPLGVASRVLCPLVGGDFTYASMETGLESAPGQVAAGDLRRLYDMMEHP